jgi:transcriptional regulator GlxA family with amidase domain
VTDLDGVKRQELNPGSINGTRLAVVSVTKDTKRCKEICDSLHLMGASLIAVTPDGQFPSGWDAGKAMRFELADSDGFDGLVIVTDKLGSEKVMESVNADHFISSFFEKGLPVGSTGYGTSLLGQLGLLEDRLVSADDEFAHRLRSQGAEIQSSPMTTDKGLTTAVSSMPPEGFVLKVAEEVKEGQH